MLPGHPSQDAPHRLHTRRGGGRGHNVFPGTPSHRLHRMGCTLGGGGHRCTPATNFRLHLIGCTPARGGVWVGAKNAPRAALYGLPPRGGKMRPPGRGAATCVPRPIQNVLPEHPWHQSISQAVGAKLSRLQLNQYSHQAQCTH